MATIHDLERFLMPQEMTHAKALSEVRAGLKLSHWIWWEFPQLRALGKSKRATDYGLKDLDEATQYLAHPVMGTRLVELSMAMMMHQGKGPEAILGPVDAMKLCTCATLFAQVPGAPAVFNDILGAFYAGVECPKTLALIATKE